MADPWKRCEVIGDCTLYLGDCLEVMPTLGKVDAVVTDPPYGLGVRWGKGGDGVWPLRDREMSGGGWDDSTCEDAIMVARGISRNAIIWGGNYYTLCASRGWLLWDKMQEHSGAHAEMAWTNLDIPVRVFRYARAQLASEGKQHPTQKPLPLMVWCLGFLPDAQTILDPFMGSGTTGVACVKLGRKFIGVELDETYFDIACKRIRDAYAQPDFFVEPPAKPEQMDMLK